MTDDRFDLSASRPKLLGVCARLGDAAHIDPLLLRVGALLMLCMAFGSTLVAYLLTAFVLRLARD